MRQVGLLLLAGMLGSGPAAAAPPGHNAATVATSKSVEQFDGCFAAAQERSSLAWSYVPKPHGGTFSNLGARGAKSIYFLAVSDHGATRQLRLEAADAGFPVDVRVARAVNQCA